MKKLTWVLAIAMVLFVMAPSFAAPLFPDVPEQHWARDAVADLAAKGILEGYPDGTFKGDRAATRWEMAMALHRFLAKMEAEHATFATKADLEALRALVNNLKDELDALGVRVKNLEDNVSALDKRVTELERITFEGDFTTRFVTIGLRNTGRKTGAWQAALGSIAGPISGNWGANDLFNGRPFVNGSGFTARARLGVKVKVSKDMNAGVRFAAYTSLGDRYIDAYWGVTAPYLSNMFTGNGVNFFGPQNMQNNTWTRMTVDNFWLEHVPSGTKLIVGSIEKTNFDDFMIHNVPNPGIDGRDRSHFEDMRSEKKTLVSAWKYWEGEDTYLPFYGIDVTGKTHLISDMKWEVMYSKLPHNNALVVPYLFGLNLDWKIKDQGNIKLNFARTSENWDSAVVHGTVPTMVPFVPGAFSNGWTDPWDYRNDNANKRPMRNAGVIGLQGQTSYGISINYRFDPSNIRVVGAYGGTQYKPNVESGFTADGNHFRLGIGWTNQNDNLDLDLEYISTDAYYDAFQLGYNDPTFSGLNGLRMNVPTMGYYGGGYQLHDSDLYPNNRNGIKFGGEYRFANGNGRVNLRVGLLQQNNSGAPHRDTTGFFNGLKPGYIDPVFGELFTNGATIPEDIKGKVTHIGGGVEYKFTPSALKGSAQYDYYRYYRDSSRANNTFIAMQNEVDLKYNALRIGLAYAFNDKFTLRGGYDYATLKGYHPAYNTGGYNAGRTVVDIKQSVPNIGFDYELGKNTQWCMDVKFYNQTDGLGNDFHTAGVEPQSFSGLQLMTQFKLKF